MRFLEILFFGRDRRQIANLLATLILIPLISAPQVLGVLFWDDFEASVLSTLGVGLLFVSTYLISIGRAKGGVLDASADVKDPIEYFDYNFHHRL